jgi:guanylate kinase
MNTLMHKEQIFKSEKYINTPFVIISGPSAGGKTFLSKQLESLFPNLCLLIKHTDRDLRDGEINGKDYYFLSPCEFSVFATPNNVIVKVSRYEHGYALSYSEIERAICAKKIPVFILDPHAALKFKEVYENCILVFVGPDFDTVKERIKDREEDCNEKRKRLDLLEEEYSLRNKFDINDYNGDVLKFCALLNKKLVELADII